ncbi:hypothetical protein LZ480_16245 [Solibacillus sp. MA9]|uniref:DUF4367 domain-containing protein n=1 Tax=Solibacillus palustris TaxID=2908203 RepID=A0ABS9UGH7_9BACL|nr:hypothetical protein [Solibacillus sp. MA9]MCH7323427.1 hypothetical protein [Solibacillus sp. MA9]
MKNMKDFNDFEERFKSEYERIQSDNKQHLIQNICSPTKRKAKKLSISFVICMCLLLAVATVGAMEYTGLTFFKSNEGTMIEITNIKEEHMKAHINADEISRKNDAIIADLKKTIPDGHFLYFKDIEVYEQTGIIDLFKLTNPPTITKIDEIPNDITQHIHLEDTLLENYHLKNGTLLYKFPEYDLDQMMEIIEQLQAQAKQQNQHYGILQGQLINEIDAITLHYETKDFPNWQAFEISIDTINTRVETTENLSNYVPLNNELGIEMYYSEEDRTLRFIMQAPSQNYLITVRNPIISRQNVDVQRFIEVAKSLTVNE